MDADQQLLTLAEVAHVLAVHPRTVRRSIADAKLAHVRIGRVIRVAAADLKAFVASRRTTRLLAR